VFSLAEKGVNGLQLRQRLRKGWQVALPDGLVSAFVMGENNQKGKEQAAAENLRPSHTHYATVAGSLLSICVVYPPKMQIMSEQSCRLHSNDSLPWSQ
jgi:hypothetical protein